MKFDITHFENQTATVKNVSGKDFSGSLPLEAGEEKTISTALAKLFFGDWDDSSFGELQRQKTKNIHLFEVTVQEGELPRAVKAKEVVEKRTKEPEFSTLEHLNTQDKGDEENVPCSAKTRAGKPCKGKAVPGSTFCGIHQKEVK